MKNRFYDRLTGAERAGLYLAALVRRDEDEVKLLLETCPRKIMSVRDPDFVALALHPNFLARVFDMVAAQGRGNAQRLKELESAPFSAPSKDAVSELLEAKEIAAAEPGKCPLCVARTIVDERNAGRGA